MAYMPSCAFMNAFLLFPVALAVPWIGATPTPEVGFKAMDAMSPRPTEAPGAGGIPRELLKRDYLNVIFPPPKSWCGFVSSSYSNRLTCTDPSLKCLFNSNGGGVQCCNPPNTPCQFYTGCDDSHTACSNNCNSGITYCTLASFSCASWVFKGASVNNYYFCANTGVSSTDVEYLSDFYLTQIGSSIANADYIPSTLTSTSTDPLTSNGASTTSVSPIPPTTPAASHKGLAVGAIAGIAVGAGCIALAVIAGIIACICIRKRRRNRAAAAQTQPRPQATFNQNLPMQQAHPSPTQNVQYPPSNPGLLNEPPQYPGSPQPSTYSIYNSQSSPMHSPLLDHDPTGRINTISPPPHSTTAPISPISQKPPILGDVETKTQTYPQPSHSPTAMDAGGIGVRPGHVAANDQDQLHEVSAEPMYAQGQKQGHTQGHIQGQNQGAVYEVPTQGQNQGGVYGVPAQGQNQGGVNGVPTQGQNQGAVYGVPTQGQNQGAFYEVPTQGQNQGTVHEVPAQGQNQGAVYEVPTQPEPRYTAYSPTFSTQQESSYTTYTQSSVQDFSDAQSHIVSTQLNTHEPFRGQQTSPGPWELSEQRGDH